MTTTTESKRPMSPLQQMQGLIDREAFRTELSAVLPESVGLDRFARIAKTAIANEPRLLECTPSSVMRALITCAGDGLVPDGREAAITWFNNKVSHGGQDHWEKQARYMPMVDGILKRARMSGEIAVIAAKAVYQSDEFDYWMDEEGEHLIYRPKLRASAEERGPLQLVFAFARLKNGELVIETMTRDDVEKVRQSSQQPNKGPWLHWYERMALKAVLHRQSRRLPNASEVRELTSRDAFLYDLESTREVTSTEDGEVLPPRSGPVARPARMQRILEQSRPITIDPRGAVQQEQAEEQPEAVEAVNTAARQDVAHQEVTHEERF